MPDSPEPISGLPAPRALLLSVGSELLLGETVDTNAAFIGRELTRIGLELREVRVVPDDVGSIAASFTQAFGGADVVLATGGLGPTHDDLTRDGLAASLGEDLVEDPDLARALVARFGGRAAMPVINLRQARLIASAEALDNPIGSAPGWWVERDGHVAVLMPGVPAEMHRMWTEQVVPRLERRLQLRPLAERTVKTFGIGESAAAAKVGGLLEAPGSGMQAGIYARDDGVHLRFSTRGDPAALEAAVARSVGLLGDDVYGTDQETLPGVAMAALARSGIASLASVESGTEGALQSILAAHRPGEGEPSYVGGQLVVEQPAGQARLTQSERAMESAKLTPPGRSTLPIPTSADALLILRLGPPERLGRSRVQVSLVGGKVGFEDREVRIHGSGAQRARRAAYAALDQVRRLTSDR